MTENASLEDFLGGQGSDDAASPASGGEAGSRGVDSSATASAGSEPDECDRGDAHDCEDGPTVDPATPTYGWGRYACGVCGASVERVWHGDDGVVCGECKDW